MRVRVSHCEPERPPRRVQARLTDEHCARVSALTYLQHYQLPDLTPKAALFGWLGGGGFRRMRALLLALDLGRWGILLSLPPLLASMASGVHSYRLCLNPPAGAFHSPFVACFADDYRGDIGPREVGGALHERELTCLGFVSMAATGTWTSQETRQDTRRRMGEDGYEK